MLFWMLPIRFKNSNPIIKKIQKRIFRKSKIRNKTKTNLWIIKNYFLPQYGIKKTKKKKKWELSGLNWSRWSGDKAVYLHTHAHAHAYVHTHNTRTTHAHAQHTHTHTHTSVQTFSKIMWYKLLTPLMIFLEKFNETQKFTITKLP